MSLSVILRYTRQKSGLSLRAAAAASGLSYSKLHRYEDALSYTLPVKELKQIITVCGFKPEALFALQDRLKKDRLRIYTESRQLITADFLYESYLKLDERGKLTLLQLLAHENDPSK